MLTDDQILSELRKVTEFQRADDRRDDALDYRITDIRARQGAVDVALEQRDGQRARLLISPPSSGAPQYWLYAIPRDARDWVEQLLIWTDDEVFTGGLGGSRARMISAGDSYVITENYGWRLADAAEHARLRAAAGPFGWNGSELN